MNTTIYVILSVSVEDNLYKNKDPKSIENEINALNEHPNKKLFKTLLVKDFSRLGGKLLFVGNQVENVLPSLNIRLIGLSDNYHSLTYKKLDL